MMTNPLCPLRDRCLDEPEAERALCLVCDGCPFSECRESLRVPDRFSAYACDEGVTEDPNDEEPGFQVEGGGVFRD